MVFKTYFHIDSLQRPFWLHWGKGTPIQNGRCTKLLFLQLETARKKQIFLSDAKFNEIPGKLCEYLP